MISKELLSEVLGYKVEIEESEHWLKSSNSVVFVDLSRKGDIADTDFINIYELAHKCKEWALTKGYFIYSTNELSFIKSFSLETIETFSNGKDTEIECILKACQWILENKED